MIPVKMAWIAAANANPVLFAPKMTIALPDFATVPWVLSVPNVVKRILIASFLRIGLGSFAGKMGDVRQRYLKSSLKSQNQENLWLC
jgi:hypothetical protein